MKKIVLTVVMFLGVLIVHAQTSQTLSSSTPLFFTSTGTGVYNQSVVYHSSNGFVLELAKLSNDISANPMDFRIGTRGATHNFFTIKGATGNVGIGTTSPGAKLDVNGVLRVSNEAADKKIQFLRTGGDVYSIEHDVSRLYFYNSTKSKPVLAMNNDGNVGIGTTTPTEKLEVKNGGVKLSTNDTTGNYELKLNVNHDYNNKFTMTSGNTVVFQEKVIPDVGGTQNSKSYLSNYYGIGFSTNVTNPTKKEDIDMYISGSNDPNGSGNVGIGTTDTKGFKLGVNGKVAATEVKIAAYANWADFVFEKEYELPTLVEVEDHIKKKGHLKDIPSAKEVEKNGFYLGEMDAKLLQKIEELTLYTIQQEKEINKIKVQEEKVKELKKENKELKDRLSNLEKLVKKLL